MVLLVDTNILFKTNETMGVTDKKRKRSKEDKDSKKEEKAKKTTQVEIHALSDIEQDAPRKRAKKDKKDKYSLKDEGKETKEKDDKKQKKEKKEKKDKKGKKDKKDKKEKKSKKEKKDKERSSASASSDQSDLTTSDDSSISSVSSAASSPRSSETELNITPMEITEEQRATKTIIEIAVQKTKAMIAEKEGKKSKKEKKEKQDKKDQDVIMSEPSDNTNSTTDSKDDGDNAKSFTTQASPKVDENGLTRKERRTLKIKQKQLNRKTEGDGAPGFVLKTGHDLTLKDLRDLVVYILTETPTLPWIQVLNKFKIDKVLMLYASGLDPSLFHINLRSSDAHKPIDWPERAAQEGGPVTELEALKELLPEINVVKAPGDKFRIFSPTNTLLNVPLSNSEKIKREKEKQNNKAAKEKKPENYMLTLEELRESDFPIPRYMDSTAPDLQSGWTETPKLPKTTLTPPPKIMIAMDCEMCRTATGSELTRVTLIDHNGATVLDELVMPENPILDYLTQYSGMTAARLEGVTTRLADVQKKVQEFVNYNTILVGHSLENDMKVLKLAHPFIIDTSILFHHTRGPPYRPGLKWLAQKWLSRQIQANAERGHDSAEDALACMDLVKLKLSKPPGFGEYIQDQESLFSRLTRFNITRTSALIDADAFAGQSATTTIRTATDQDVVEAIPEAIQKHNFVWARLRDVEINHGKAPTVVLAEGQMVDTGRASKLSSRDKIQATEEEIRRGMRSIDQSIKKIIESLPPRTAVIVTSGQGDHRQVSEMQHRQKVFTDLFKTKDLSEIPEEDRFLEEDEQKLAEAVEKAKSGVCFLMVKGE
ncbi:hypothetical protein EC968_000177 [Mortierella alpina]|nr:hypothetical protein EC968_000177 [Mortierella alpina]